MTKAVACAVAALLIGWFSTGASLLLSTVKMKSSLVLAPLASVTRTRSDQLPMSAAPGVPLKIRVAGSNCNQVGRAAPLTKLAA